MEVDLLCPLCMSEPEMDVHVFLFCPHVQQFWFASQLLLCELLIVIVPQLLILCSNCLRGLLMMGAFRRCLLGFQPFGNTKVGLSSRVGMLFGSGFCSVKTSSYSPFLCGHELLLLLGGWPQMLGGCRPRWTS